MPRLTFRVDERGLPSHGIRKKQTVTKVRSINKIRWRVFFCFSTSFTTVTIMPAKKRSGSTTFPVLSL